MLVIDASVYVADARPRESHHAEARALLSWVVAKGESVCAPMIVLAEVASAISRGTGSPILARRWVVALQGIPGLRFVPVDEILGRAAAELAARHQIRGCDAVFVALAQQQGATLITLDRQQRERVPPDVVACTPAEALVDVD